ncbi:MAG: class I SAM-dependent methyltransferase [Methanosarcinaceae archaeon]|nr:class I SAM-dependent methyltransferase [Methanosarcinaceae archaeon]
MLSKEKIQEIYASILLGKDHVLAADDIQLKYMRHFLPEEKSITILDAGCGNGRYAFQLVQDGYKELYAVDLFENIKTDRFVYHQTSIDELPFEKSFFDFIYCNSVIFYLQNPEKAILEFNRVLKKGGIVFITAHTKHSLFTLWRCIKRWAGSKSAQHLTGVRFYSAKQYCVSLNRNGFKIVRVDGYKLSFFIYPTYRKVVRACDKFLNMKLPLSKNEITRSKLMAKLKSIFGYHSIIVARNE